MAHAVLMIFDCDCPACNHKFSRANAEGLDGHGPVWRKLAQAVEREANLSLERVGNSWNKDVHVGGRFTSRGGRGDCERGRRGKDECA